MARQRWSKRTKVRGNPHEGAIFSAGLLDDVFGLVIRKMVIAPEPHRL
jgi:hypothetical protein